MLQAHLTSPRFDAKVAQIACFAAGLLVFVAAVLKLCSLPVTEWQLLIGLLATSPCLLLCILLGLLVPMVRRSCHDDP